MSDPNIYISNGTCYSAPGRKLDDGFIPCGNDAFGHVTCCGAGDNCLADNACWGVHGSGYGSSLTYIAGCTDPDYEDESCPKKFFDQDWEALTLCDDSNGDWAPCSQEGDPSTLQPGSFCSCTDAASTTIAVQGTDPLSSIASLPGDTGESIQFFAGYFPSQPSSPETTGEADDSESEEDGSNTTPTPTTSESENDSSPDATSPPEQVTSSPTNSGSGQDPDDSGAGSDSGSNGSGLGTGAKVGIGVGVAVALLILLAAIGLVFLRHRRQRRNLETESKSPVSGASATPAVPEADGQPVVETDGKAARPWSMRSELEGSNPVNGGALHAGSGPTGGHATPSEGLGSIAELPGDGSWHGRDI